jgi:ABC-type transport system involved in Fe-S cluster assembly fused permease/ATPase subunit
MAGRQDIRNVSLASLRNRIGVVPQVRAQRAGGLHWCNSGT